MDLLTPFIPNPDVADVHETVIHAPADQVFRAQCAMRFDDSRVIHAIFRLRDLALSVTGRKPGVPAPPGGIIEQTKAIGWGVLANTEGRNIVMGAAAKPWRRDVTFHPLLPEQFASWHEPGWVKIAWSLEAIPVADDLAIARTRTAAVATDDESRRRFRRYWGIFSPGIRLIRRFGLRMVKRDAERMARLYPPVRAA